MGHVGHASGTSGGFGGSNCGGSMAIGLAGSGESGVPGGSHMVVQEGQLG